jgi:hypothetical protein
MKQRISRPQTKAANDPVAGEKPSRAKAKSSAKSSVKPASKPAEKSSAKPPLSNDIRIFQIHFKEDHAEHLDPSFEQYDNHGVEDETHEFAVFEKLHAKMSKAAAKGVTHWGAVSWRFKEKTGLAGDELIKLVKANPDVDVFYMNPYPYNEALFQSGWMQGHTTHPDFLKIAAGFLEAAGLDAAEINRVTGSASFSSANYFVGKAAFWDRYLPFIRGAIRRAEIKMPLALRKKLHSSTADPRNLHHGSTYLPFIIERMFPAFMAAEGGGLVARKVALPAREKELNEHLKSLRQMKDAAIKGKSEWLLKIWMNYRNLYLQSVCPKDWCAKYLPALNPKGVVW